MSRLSALLLGIAVFSLAGIVSLDGVSWDDSWFLQVVTRVVSGDVLYRDVSFGSTPLSVYLTAPLVWAFGSQIVWLRVLVNLCLAISAVALTRMARGLGAGRWAYLLPLALLALAVPGEGSPYGTLAALFMLGAFLAALSSSESGGSLRAAFVAGACSGLAFASKYNVGFLAILAVVAAFGCEGRNQRRGLRIGLATVTFAGVAASVLIPVFATGASAQFWDFAFAGKGTYVDRTGPWYAGQIDDLGSAIVGAHSLRGLRLLGAQATTLVPVVSLLLVGLAFAADRGRRGRSAAVGAFCVAAFVSVFPPSTGHVRELSPLFLGAIAYALFVLSPRIAPRLRRAGRATVAIVLLATVASWTAIPLTHLAEGRDFSRLPHFRGTILRAEDEDEARANATRLRQASDGRPLFLLVPNAGFYYLVSGLSDPTPFDYPLATTYGARGEQDVIEQIAAGKIAAACVDVLGVHVYGLEPRTLLAYVQTKLRPGANLGVCRMYYRRP